MADKIQIDRSQRAAALAEKKRRLEEKKKKRAMREKQEAEGGQAGNAIEAAKRDNLDDYIKKLLEEKPPAGASSLSSSVHDVSTPVGSGIVAPSPFKKDSEVSSEIKSGVATPIKTAEEVTMVPKSSVETFEICTQTDEHDFPPLGDNEDDEDEKEDNDKQNVGDKNDKQNGEEKKEESQNNDSEITMIEPKLLSESEVNGTISSTNFTSFFNSASKKVERYLGSSILNDLLVDDMMYYTDMEAKRNDASRATGGGKSSHSLIAAQVTFEYPKWTAGRDITSIDWSVHHRGEVMMASYHMPSSSSSSASGSTAMKSIVPNATPSSSLLPQSRSETTQADGLNIIWNLTMPNRPEHILTCGSPVLESKFHPTEGNLVVGACYSGQVVVWDVRSGRLPVQRSTLNLLGGAGNSSGGHYHPVVGMEVLDGGSGLVTAASDGTVNFWSLSNFIEPEESIKIPGANLSSFSVAPESQSIIAGDESGAMYAIVQEGGAQSRRIIRKLKTKEETKEGGVNNLCHYGPVTGLSTKMTSQSDDSNGVSLSKGFARGTKGMVLTCGVDWTTKLWSPAHSDKPLLNLLSHSYDYMSDVQWSPILPSIFATGSSNGTLSFWNLASSIDEPVTGLDGIAIEKNDDTLSSPSPCGINKLRWSADGRRIAVGCSDKLHVLGLSEELWKPNGDEEQRLMNNLKSRGLLDGVVE